MQVRSVIQTTESVIKITLYTEAPIRIYKSDFYFFFQAEDGIRDQPRSRGLGDVYKRQCMTTRVSRNSIGRIRVNTGCPP